LDLTSPYVTVVALFAIALLLLRDRRGSRARDPRRVERPAPSGDNDVLPL